MYKKKIRKVIIQSIHENVDRRMFKSNKRGRGAEVKIKAQTCMYGKSRKQNKENKRDRDRRADRTSHSHKCVVLPV